MSVLELKQHLSRLSVKERHEIQLYLLRLKQETPAQRKTTARKIRAMKAGKGTSIEKLESIYARG